jgi:hypothetical protein
MECLLIAPRNATRELRSSLAVVSAKIARGVDCSIKWFAKVGRF